VEIEVLVYSVEDLGTNTGEVSWLFIDDLPGWWRWLGLALDCWRHSAMMDECLANDCTDIQSLMLSAGSDLELNCFGTERSVMSCRARSVALHACSLFSWMRVVTLDPEFHSHCWVKLDMGDSMAEELTCSQLVKAGWWHPRKEQICSR
jgi:hypothetical protein